MKVLSESTINSFLATITRKSLINEYFPLLVDSLMQFSKNPSDICPPRTVKQSNTPHCDTTHLFMPCIAPHNLGIKIVSGGPQNSAAGLGFQGCILVLNELTGKTEAIVNAAAVTAFRTALATCAGLYLAIPHDNLVLPELCVFGAGPQALWHVKLALLLYHDRITTVNVISRTLETAQKLCDKLSPDHENVRFSSFLFDSPDSELSRHTQNSSIIFGCVPSTEPVIKGHYINTNARFPKFIGLVGSYKPHMIELDTAIVSQSMEEGAKIIVDSIPTTLCEAGELIQAGADRSHLVELHEQYSHPNTRKLFNSHNVCIQKIVGLAVMDISIGKHLVSSIDYSHGAADIAF